MNELEDALRSLPDRLELTPRGDLVTSVRRLHARRALRRRSGIAAATVGFTALAAVPGVVISRRGEGRGRAATSSAEQRPITIESLDADLAQLASAPRADEPRASAGFAYVRTRSMFTSGFANAISTSGIPSALSPAALEKLGSAGAIADAKKPSAQTQAGGVNKPVAEGTPPKVETNGPGANVELKSLLPLDPASMLTYGEVQEREVWRDPAGAGRLQSKTLPPVFFRPGDEQKYDDADLAQTKGKLQKGDLGNELAAQGSPGGKITNPSFQVDLPVDPVAMQSWLRKIAGDYGTERADEAIFTAARDLLRENVLPLRVRVAVYRALLKVPGVKVADAVADFDGRTGVGIGLVSDQRGTLEQIIIDPITGAQLGERESLTVANELGPVGTVVGHSAILEASFVPTVGGRPAP